MDTLYTVYIYNTDHREADLSVRELSHRPDSESQNKGKNLENA